MHQLHTLPVPQPPVQRVSHLGGQRVKNWNLWNTKIVKMKDRSFESKYHWSIGFGLAPLLVDPMYLPLTLQNLSMAWLHHSLFRKESHEKSDDPSDFSSLWIWNLKNIQRVWHMGNPVIGFCMCSACVGCCAVHYVGPIRHNSSPAATKYFWTWCTISVLSTAQLLLILLFVSLGHGKTPGKPIATQAPTLPSDSWRKHDDSHQFFRNTLHCRR